MKLETYEAEVQINGTTVPEWRRFEVVNRIGVAEKTYSVDLVKPILLHDGDTIRIREGIEGVMTDLLETKEIEVTSGSAEYRNISGAGTKITRKAPSKTLIFVNGDWLKQICPTYYLLDGIIHRYRLSTGQIKKNRGVSFTRLMIPGYLPGKETKDGEFECVVREGGFTYKDIGNYLVSKIGLTLHVNTPDLALQKTFVVSSSTPYWQAIVQLFSIWRPQIFVVGNELWVVDQGGDKQAKPGASKNQHITMTTDSFSVYQWGFAKDYNIVDHVVVKGADSSFTYEVDKDLTIEGDGGGGGDPGGEKQTITKVEVYTISQQEAQEHLYDQDMADARIRKRVTVTERRINPFNRNDAVVVKETQTIYGGTSSVKYYERVTEYKWHGFSRCLGCDETTYMRFPQIAGGTTETVVGGVYQQKPTTYVFEEVERRQLRYKNYISSVGVCDIDELVIALCAYWSRKEKDGTVSYSEVRPVSDHVQIGGAAIAEENDSSGYGWKSGWYTTRLRTVRYDQAARNLLHKTVTVQNFVPHYHFRSVTEDIPIEPEVKSGVDKRRWEYYRLSSGTIYYRDDDADPPAGDYHPKVEIQAPDVVTEAQARQVAERVMTAYQTGTSAENTVGVIETTIPIVGVVVGGTITLPACTKQYFDLTENKWKTVTMPEKTYWIVSNTRITEYGGDPGSPQRSFRAFNRIELKEYY